MLEHPTITNATRAGNTVTLHYLTPDGHAGEERFTVGTAWGLDGRASLPYQELNLFEGSRRPYFTARLTPSTWQMEVAPLLDEGEYR